MASGISEDDVVGQRAASGMTVLSLHVELEALGARRVSGVVLHFIIHAKFSKREADSLLESLSIAADRAVRASVRQT